MLKRITKLEVILSILLAFNNSNFSSEVVDPLTEKPSSKREIANGFPNQPHPKILTLFIN